MGIELIRNFLIDKISAIQDEKYLAALNTILDAYSGEMEPYNLTKEQQRKVRLGIEQARNGEIISNEDLEKEDEWLKE